MNKIKKALVVSTVASMVANEGFMGYGNHLQKKVKRTYNKRVVYCPTCKKNVFAKEIVKRKEYYHEECGTNWEVKL